jgi:hypothetical protein
MSKTKIEKMVFNESKRFFWFIFVNKLSPPNTISHERNQQNERSDHQQHVQFRFRHIRCDSAHRQVGDVQRQGQRLGNVFTLRLRITYGLMDSDE